jgi:hypothetical protein
MKTYKDQIVSYISMLNIMRSKFNFGSDQVISLFNLVFYKA